MALCIVFLPLKWHPSYCCLMQLQVMQLQNLYTQPGIVTMHEKHGLIIGMSHKPFRLVAVLQVTHK